MSTVPKSIWFAVGDNEGMYGTGGETTGTMERETEGELGGEIAGALEGELGGELGEGTGDTKGTGDGIGETEGTGEVGGYGEDGTGIKGTERDCSDSTHTNGTGGGYASRLN